MRALARALVHSIGRWLGSIGRFLRRTRIGRILVFLSLPLALLVVALWVGPERTPPIFDVQMHYNEDAWEGYPARGVLRGLDKLNVPWVLVSSTPNAGTFRLHELDSKRVVPLFQPYRTRDDRYHWFQDAAVIPWMESELALGRYRGVGEIHLVEGGVDTPVVRRLLALAVAQRLVLNVHASMPVIRQLFTLEPGIRVIWAHAGATVDPWQVREMLFGYPGLWAELSHRPDIAPDGELPPAWRELFLNYSERLLLGSGTYTPENWYHFRYILGHYRNWLRQLPPEIAERIAYRNALRLFGMQ